jgi:hypothetical protein
VWHPGPDVRYCLITSWESGPELGAYIAARNPRSRVPNAPIDAAMAAAAQAEVDAKRAARAAAAGGAMVDAKSEA